MKIGAQMLYMAPFSSPEDIVAMIAAPTLQAHIDALEAHAPLMDLGKSYGGYDNGAS